MPSENWSAGHASSPSTSRPPAIVRGVVCSQCDAEVAADRGLPPVRSDHQPAGDLVGPAPVPVAHHRRVARSHVDVTDAAEHERPGHHRGLVQRLARLRVPDVQHSRHAGQHLVERGGCGLGLLRIGRLVVEDGPRDVVATGVEQRLLQVQP